jgi:outer membrane receptor protein involved in Fe transport
MFVVAEKKIIMKIYIKIVLLVILLDFTATVSIAQPPVGEYYIKGQIIDGETDEFMEYVNVVVYSKRDSLLITGTITDNKGKFNIRLNRGGKYYITADFIGYEKIAVSDVFVSPDNEIYNVGVMKISPAALDIHEVEVVAERPFVSYKLDRKVVEVSRNPMAQGGTAVDALENVPSVEVDLEGNVSVRGSSDFTVLIDGRQSALSGTDALNQIPASTISQIEIITNPSAKYDPDGTAGILNIITKKGKLQGHSVVANASIGNAPLYSSDLAYSYRHKKYTLTTSFGFRDMEMPFKHYYDRETKSFDAITGEQELSYLYNDRDGLMKIGSYNAKAGFDYHLSDANTFTIGANYNNFLFARNYDSRIKTIDPGGNTNYEISATRYEVRPKSWQINIGDEHIFNDNKDHYLRADLLYQRRDKTTEDYLNKYATDSVWQNEFVSQLPEKAITLEDASRIRLELDYSLPIKDNLLLEAGYTLRNDAYDQYYSRYFADSSSNEFVRNGEYDDEAEYQRVINAGWLVIKGQLYGIQYSAGLRLEHTDRNIKTEKDNWDYNYNYLGWYPSLSLAKEWEGGHTLQTSYSKRISRPRDYHLNPFPSLSDGYTQWLPNPTLEPEYASSVEVNYQKAWGQTFIAVETFYRHTTNEMDRVQTEIGDTLVRTIINLGSESDMGAELAANFKITKWWSFNPTFTYSYNQVNGTYLNNNTDVFSNIYRVRMNNNFFLPTKTRIQLMSFYNSPMNEIDGTREQMYWLTVAVRQDFLDRKLSATVRVDDVFGTRKREGYTYTDNSIIYSTGQRRSPMITFSMSYKFNQQNQNKRNGSPNGNEEGMDMDF